jgi:Zn-dependent M28 family amino/carboxypeptidase
MTDASSDTTAPTPDHTQRANGNGSPTDAARLRATIEQLQGIERPPCSPGEEAAARWIAAALAALGASSAVEEELAFHDFATPISQLSFAAAAAGLVASHRRGRALGVLVSLAAALAIAEDVSNGPRLFRRLTMRPRATWNVVGEIGAVAGSASDGHVATVVILAHHDAAPTGQIFDPTLQRLVGDLVPGLLERRDTSLPLWWPVVGFPLLVAAGARARRPGLRRAGVAGSLVAALALADIARSPISPGANDNLTGVAALLAVAETLVHEPAPGIRVLLVSCGSEESLQGGMRAFGTRHFPQLDRERTWVLNLETVGSPELIMLEGEGTMVMEDYHARGFRDRVARAADGAGIHLRRGMRARSSTDSVIPSRAGYPTATLTSMDRNKWLTHYHLMSDTAENVDYGTVGEAVGVAVAVVRELASRTPRPRVV